MNDIQFFIFWSGFFGAFLACYTRHVGPDLIAPSLCGALILHIYLWLHSRYLVLMLYLKQRKNKNE
jgi:hypothetical protein